MRAKNYWQTFDQLDLLQKYFCMFNLGENKISSPHVECSKFSISDSTRMAFSSSESPASGLLLPLLLKLDWDKALDIQNSIYILVANMDTSNSLTTFFSSEGALYVILPYDYPQQQQHPLFEHTPVLNNNFEYWCHDDFVDCDFYED